MCALCIVLMPHLCPTQGHFMPDSGAFYTCSYNHARRLRLGQLLSIISSPTYRVNRAFLEVPAGILKPLLGPGWIQVVQNGNGRNVAASEVKRP